MGRNSRNVGRNSRNVGREAEMWVGIFRNEGRDTRNVDRNFRNVGRNIRNVGRNIRNVGRNIRNLGSNIRNVGRNIINVGRNIRNVEICETPLEAVFLINIGLRPYPDPSFADTLKLKILHFLFSFLPNFSLFQFLSYNLSKVYFYVLIILMNTVADPHHIDAGPDPDFHFYADPTFCSRARPGHG